MFLSFNHLPTFSQALLANDGRFQGIVMVVIKPVVVIVNYYLTEANGTLDIKYVAPLAKFISNNSEFLYHFLEVTSHIEYKEVLAFVYSCFCNLNHLLFVILNQIDSIVSIGTTKKISRVGNSSKS
jgi:hypothetical protein